jgi:hypothetical protein
MRARTLALAALVTFITLVIAPVASAQAGTKDDQTRRDDKPILGLTITRDAKDEKEIELGFAAKDIKDAVAAGKGPFGRDAFHWAAVLLRYLAVPGKKEPLFGESDKARTVLAPKITELCDALYEIKDNVNRPEEVAQKRDAVRSELAARSAEAYNLVLKQYQGNLEDARFTGAACYEEGVDILMTAGDRLQPFAVIEMSAYELWASDRVKAMKDDDPKSVRCRRFLNRLLLERFCGDKAPFATKTLGKEFLAEFARKH